MKMSTLQGPVLATVEVQMQMSFCLAGRLKTIRKLPYYYMRCEAFAFLLQQLGIDSLVQIPQEAYQAPAHVSCWLLSACLLDSYSQEAASEHQPFAHLA